MQLKVKVERVAYPKPHADTSEGAVWRILLTDQGACKGTMSWRPMDGEALILDGRWTAYQGKKEFKFDGAMQDIPISARDQLRYVCERTKGVGFAMETTIWEKYGDNWQDIEAGEIDRMSDAVYERFRVSMEALTTEKEKSQTIAFLMGKGATVGMATAAWEQWEKQGIGIVNDNCYRLADLPNYGFCHVDTDIRRKFDIGDSDPRRIKAALVYSLRQLSQSGNTVSSWGELRGAVMKHTGGVSLQLVVDCVKEMFGDGTLRGFTKSQSLALGADFQNEKDIWEYVA